MGCDIHLFVEVKDSNGKWASADTWTKEEDYIHVKYEDQFYNGRNYELFALLANVRNYDKNKPIALPRGLPTDASEEVLECSNYWGEDGHSHSYFTVEELKRFVWNKPICLSGWVTSTEFSVFLQKGSPDSWCGGVMGDRVKQVSVEEMKTLVNTNSFDSKYRYYTFIEWKESYEDYCRDFLKALEEIALLGDPSEVRIVFWFDN